MSAALQLPTVPSAVEHAQAIRHRQGKLAPMVSDLSDEDLLVRHYSHVATQGLYLTGNVSPYVEQIHAAGLRLLTNRSWGLRKTDQAAIRTVVRLALQYGLGIETY
jgi:hypothetical protein